MNLSFGVFLFIVSILFYSETISAHFPVGALIKETVDALGNIQKNIQRKAQNRQRQATGLELVQDIHESVVEDYIQNHGSRVQRMCEYLKQGQLYRGPCPKDTNYNNGNNGRYNDYAGYNNGPKNREEEKYIRRLEKQQRKEERKQRRGQQNRGQDEVIEKKIIIIKPVDGSVDYGNQQSNNDYGNRRSSNDYENRRGSNDYGNRPSNNGYENRGSGNDYGNRRVIGNRGNDYEKDYKVLPETIVNEEEDDYEPAIRRPPNVPQRSSGSQRIKSESQRENRDPNDMTPCQTNNGFSGLCMPASYCFAQYSDLEDYRSNICERFDSGANGICCPTEGDRVGKRFDNPIRIPQQSKPSTNVGFISLEDINVAAKEAHKFIENYIEQERQLVRNGMIQQHGSMQSLHQAFFGDFDPVQFRLTIGGFINLITTIRVKRKFKLSNEQARDGLYKYSIVNTDLEKYCIPEPSCRQGKYRTIDGSCNNLQRPLWGKSNTAFERLLPPHYDDGLHEPRTLSVNQGKLPSARWVSHESARNRNIPDPKYTLMLMQWGQFLDHDLTLAASTRAATGQGLICCHPETQRKVDHHACFPIEIPNNDQFYSKHNQRCMHFVRNSPAPRSGCALGHREQMNTLTQIIDGSMVYGSTQERAKLLRSFRGGKLKTSNVHQEFLPFDRGNHSDDCAIPERDQRQFKCFLGGDVRVNEQTGLTMIHALFVREHNRIAEELARLNPDWSDINLFQEARRIVAAEIQHITYNEWLPIIISPSVMKQFGLLPKTFDYTYNYDPKVNPNILNEFATAAFRFHSLVQGTFRALDNNGQPTQIIRLHTIFNNPLILYNPNAFDQFLNGFTSDPGQTWDNFFTDELTNRLFQAEGTSFGMDLVALNIQRGRDHGLPGYNHYRGLCGLQPARSFEDLNRFMQPGAAEVFSRLYNHVDDIDLFIGGVHEDPLPDALVGPVFACIVAEQFRRLKIGDRFWYENGKLPHSFSKKQLMEIRKASIASLICDNTNTIAQIQPLAFLRPGGWNSKISCRQIARMNLSPWRNERIDF